MHNLMKSEFLAIKPARCFQVGLLMSSLVKPHNWSFLRKQESRKIKEKTGFPLKNCGNDGNISNVLLLMNSLVILQGQTFSSLTGQTSGLPIIELQRPKKGVALQYPFYRAALSCN